MLHTDAQSLINRGDRLFSQKQVLDSRNQDIAEHFYPERADFTTTRNLGDDFAGHLMTGYPAMLTRDLANSVGAMLRPKGEQWLYIRADREEREDHEAKAWLEWSTGVQNRAQADPKAMFNMATKQADRDVVTFGNAVISTEVNRRDTSLLYRCWHLRDCAWAEDSYDQNGETHRNWEPTVEELCYYFPNTVHANTEKAKAKDPHAKRKVRHIVIRADMYTGAKAYRQPWVSMFVDCENQHILEERGSWTPIYTIPGWARLSGSQYSYSPATTIAIPDARLLQAMTLSMLEAGEKSANPPMIGVSEALRGDLQLFAGGFTAVDAEYDERLGEVLRPLTQDRQGIAYGLEMADRVQAMLQKALYISALSMPPTGGPDMTAYEVGQRVQENIRNVLPLFDPLEDSYNGGLAEITFDTLMHENTFGPPESIPKSIRGSDVRFQFKGPLADMIERQKGQKFIEAKSMLAQAVDIDPSVTSIIDFPEAVRDVLTGIGTPAKWMRSPDAVKQAAQDEADAAQVQQMLGAMQQGADVAATLGQASESLGPM